MPAIAGCLVFALVFELDGRAIATSADQAPAEAAPTQFVPNSLDYWSARDHWTTKYGPHSPRSSRRPRTVRPKWPGSFAHIGNSAPLHHPSTRTSARCRNWNSTEPDAFSGGEAAVGWFGGSRGRNLLGCRLDGWRNLAAFAPCIVALKKRFHVGVEDRGYVEGQEL
jgi:hypothetical protein